ncbi:MAG: DUF5518 domain-containing protein [Methanobrevibacter sp.]|nr:DUF5518 domain-containing protein [Methanobrevibacter sp.]
MIVKFGPIIIGIILALLVKMLMAPFDLIGLIVVGLVVGYMVADGAVSGLVNSVIVGIIEGIVGVLIYAFTNSYTSVQSFIIYELSAYTPMTDLNVIIYYLIYLCVIMGISGAIGGVLNKGR